MGSTTESSMLGITYMCRNTNTRIYDTSDVPQILILQKDCTNSVSPNTCITNLKDSVIIRSCHDVLDALIPTPFGVISLLIYLKSIFFLYEYRTIRTMVTISGMYEYHLPCRMFIRKRRLKEINKQHWGSSIFTILNINLVVDMHSGVAWGSILKEQSMNILVQSASMFDHN
jgi:hypothetical protein